MKRYPRVSGWARPFLDGPTQFEDAEQNVTPSTYSQPLLLWHREQVARALVRSRDHQRKAGAYAVRAALAFVLWQLHLGAWVSAPAFIAAVVCGLMVIIHLECWNVARMESGAEL